MKIITMWIYSVMLVCTSANCAQAGEPEPGAGQSIPAHNLNILMWQSAALEQAWLSGQGPVCSGVRDRLPVLDEALQGLQDELIVMRGAAENGTAVSAAYSALRRQTRAMLGRMEQALAVCTAQGRGQALQATGMDELLRMEMMRMSMTARDACLQVAQAARRAAVDCR